MGDGRHAPHRPRVIGDGLELAPPASCPTGYPEALRPALVCAKATQDGRGSYQGPCQAPEASTDRSIFTAPEAPLGPERPGTSTSSSPPPFRRPPPAEGLPRSRREQGPEAGRGALGRPGARLPSVRMWCGSLSGSSSSDRPWACRADRMRVMIGGGARGGKRSIVVTTGQNTDMLVRDLVDQSMLAVDASRPAP